MQEVGKFVINGKLEDLKNSASVNADADAAPMGPKTPEKYEEWAANLKNLGESVKEQFGQTTEDIVVYATKVPNPDVPQRAKGSSKGFVHPIGYKNDFIGLASCGNQACIQVRPQLLVGEDCVVNARNLGLLGVGSTQDMTGPP